MQDAQAEASKSHQSNTNQACQANPPVLLNGKLNFQRLPLKIYLEQSAEQAKTIQAQRKARQAAKQARKIQAKIDQTEKDRIRKADYQERVVAWEIQNGIRDADGKPVPARSQEVCCQQSCAPKIN